MWNLVHLCWKWHLCLDTCTWVDRFNGFLFFYIIMLPVTNCWIMTFSKVDESVLLKILSVTFPSRKKQKLPAHMNFLMTELKKWPYIITTISPVASFQFEIQPKIKPQSSLQISRIYEQQQNVYTTEIGTHMFHRQAFTSREANGRISSTKSSRTYIQQTIAHKFSIDV
jgi:hypothetical protein